MIGLSHLETHSEMSSPVRFVMLRSMVCLTEGKVDAEEINAGGT
jgi:hypothetical protein